MIKIIDLTSDNRTSKLGEKGHSKGILLRSNGTFPSISPLFDDETDRYSPVVINISNTTPYDPDWVMAPVKIGKLSEVDMKMKRKG